MSNSDFYTCVFKVFTLSKVLLWGEDRYFIKLRKYLPSPILLKVLVAQSRLTLCNPMDCSPLGSSAHGIFLARILEWVAISFSRGSFCPRDQTWVSCIAGSSVQFSRSVVSNSLLPYESQYARPPCPTPSPGVHSNSRPLSR